MTKCNKWAKHRNNNNKRTTVNALTLQYNVSHERMYARMYTQTFAVLTSCWNEVSIWDEKFVAIMFLQDIRENLQGEAFLLPGLLTPLVRIHLGVGQVRIVVFVF